MLADDNLLEVRGLKKYFSVEKGGFSWKAVKVKAVDGVSFSVRRGQTLGLVGESGCGKTTTGRAILRLIEPTAGEVLFEGEDILKLDRKRLQARRKEMQIIFQDPYESLNPRMTVGGILTEALKVRGSAGRQGIKERVAELLELVGLPSLHTHRYPHELSGGQRQRVGIARALATEPKFIVADEPVSALDVSVQAQIINLLQDLQERFRLTYLFISHDLSVVGHISDQVAVMYLGRIMELADKGEIYRSPLHPYTQTLLSAVPLPKPRRRGRYTLLPGDVPDPSRPPSGCPFHPRCPRRRPKCMEVIPELREVDKGHWVSCLFM